MQRAQLFVKSLLIAAVTLVILIALQMIESQINARSDLQESVLRNIAESSAEAQTLIGPVLLIQYKEERQVPQLGADGRPTAPKTELFEQARVLPATQLTTRGGAQVETRQRGIYRGQLYHMALTLEGTMELPEKLLGNDGKPMLEPRAFLLMSVSDLRGVDNAPEATVGGKKIKFETKDGRACTKGCIAGAGMYADLGPVRADQPRRIDFSIPLNLSGTQRLAIAPVADSNTVELRSDWPHPNFGGRFLPRERQVDDSGFVARWQISHLSRDFAKAAAGDRELLQVTLMDPVNVYLLAIRAVKYGILFVVLTFGGFFMAETLRRAPIHPVQYLLVGLALAVFFLLLIALSEHVAFVVSYAVSAAACISLITYYLAGALGGWRVGLGAGAGLTGLYGVLFGILHSEDNALLIGSLLLFVALGCVMVGTRRLDWYSISGSKATGEGA